jgi:hypothetical protein
MGLSCPRAAAGPVQPSVLKQVQTAVLETICRKSGRVDRTV